MGGEKTSSRKKGASLSLTRTSVGKGIWGKCLQVPNHRAGIQVFWTEKKLMRGGTSKGMLAAGWAGQEEAGNGQMLRGFQGKGKC